MQGRIQDFYNGGVVILMRAKTFSHAHLIKTMPLLIASYIAPCPTLLHHNA